MRILDERRRFFRHPYSVPIRLELSPGAEVRHPVTKDLSIGGISFVWREKIARGKRVGIEIAVRRRTFEVNGRVAYSHEEEGGGWRTGVTFLDAPSAFRAKIAEEVLQILDFRTTLSKESGTEVSEEEAAARWLERHARGD
jgi:hypothetical protein